MEKVSLGNDADQISILVLHRKPSLIGLQQQSRRVDERRGRPNRIPPLRAALFDGRERCRS
jgi:hypothetical protein